MQCEGTAIALDFMWKALKGYIDGWQYKTLSSAWIADISGWQLFVLTELF